MVDESWGQCVQVEVTHPIRAHNHSGMLFMERIHDGLQRLRRRIEIVRVQLYGKATAIGTINRFVPASANA